MTDPKSIVQDQISKLPISEKRKIFPPMTKKNFVVRKSWYGRNQLITFVTKSGKSVTYNHDTVLDLMLPHLEIKNAWKKYGYWSQSTELPTLIRYRTDLLPEADQKFLDELSKPKKK